MRIPAFNPAVKKPGREANQSSPCCAEISYNAIPHTGTILHFKYATWKRQYLEKSIPIITLVNV
jgi:hypothetical protein